MKALILAGGYGTRLRPLTCSRPKQLLPLGESTLIEHLLKQLKLSGVTEVILATGHNNDDLQQALGNGTQHGIRLHFSVEPHPLGTAGAIKLAEPYLPQDTPFLVLNGDIVSDIPYNHLLHYHQQHHATATIALFRVEDPTRFGVVDISPTGQIHHFIEKPHPGRALSNLVNAGCYVLEYTVMDHIPAHQEVSIEYDVFPTLCHSVAVYGWEHHGFWIDTGTPQSFLAAHHTLRKQLQKAPLVGFNSRIASSATIGPHVTVGNRVAIGANTHISHAVIFDDAIIGNSVVIDHSIVGRGAIIGNDLHLEAYTIVGDKAILDSGSIIHGGARICPQYHVEKGTQPPPCLVKDLKFP
jgi:mannose-1-phosphate guanylyltransferase